MVWIFKERIKTPKINAYKKMIKRKDEEPWERIHSIADENEDGMVDLFLDTVKETKAGTNRNEIRRSYLNGDENGVINSIPIEGIFIVGLGASEVIFREVFNKVGNEMVNYLPPKLMDFKFNEEEPRGMNWIRERTGELIREVTEETRRAIRREVKNAFLDGFGADRSADNIINLIGLTERHARAVVNYRDNLIMEGASLRFAKDKSEEYAGRLLRWRAENIARTELMNAANEGHLEMLLQLADSGVINPNLVRREWIVTPDDRLCRYCEPLDGQVTTIDGFFITELGLVNRPPLHPSCRCVTGTIFLD